MDSPCGPSPKPTSSNRGVVAAAALSAVGTLGSRILGLVRDQLLFALFSRTVTDAFSVAFRLPNMFRRLLGEGSLAVAFIPVYVSIRRAGGPGAEAEARRLAGSIFTLLLSITGLISAVGIVFMEPLLDWMVSGQGYRSVPGKFEITVRLGQLTFGYLFLVTTYAYLSALLQAHGRFFVAALAPAAFNLVFIIFSLLPASWVSSPGDWLGWGVLAGGVAQAGMVVVLLWRMGRLPGLGWGAFWVPPVRKILRNMVPGLLGLGVLQIMSIVNVKYASLLPEGSQSYIYLGDRLLELPQALIAISLGTALLPNLSELWSQGRHDDMRAAAHRITRLFLFLSLPCAVVLFVLAKPIVEVLFGRGTFSAADVGGTVQVVQIYSVLLVTSGLARVTVPSFYAIHNTWLPALVSLICLVVHVGWAWFFTTQYGLKGLVVATTLTGSLNYFLLLIAYRYWIGSIRIFSLLGSVTLLLPALAACALAGHFSYFWVFETAVLGGGTWAGVLALTTALSVSVFVYFTLSLLMRVPECLEMQNSIRRRRRAG